MINHEAAVFGNKGAGSRIKDWSEDQKAKADREQRILTVRRYLALRKRFGCELKPKAE